MEKRRFERKAVSLDAEIILKGKSHAGRIISLSEKGVGIFLESAFTEYATEVDSGAKVELIFKPLSEKILKLRCEFIWSKIYKNLTNLVGLIIIEQSPEYKAFVESF